MDGNDDGDDNGVEHKEDILTVIRKVLLNQEEKMEEQEKQGKDHHDGDGDGDGDGDDDDDDDDDRYCHQ